MCFTTIRPHWKDICHRIEKKNKIKKEIQNLQTVIASYYTFDNAFASLNTAKTHRTPLLSLLTY